MAWQDYSFSPGPAREQFRCLPPWAQELSWGIFLHLVGLCTSVLEEREERPGRHSGPAVEDWVVFPVHRPGFLQWWLPRDDSRIIMSGHCAFLCNKTHTWPQGDTFAAPGSLSTSCVLWTNCFVLLCQGSWPSRVGSNSSSRFSGIW